MPFLDFAVVGSYLLIVLILVWRSARRRQSPEDFFLGGRSFGTCMQACAVFGTGPEARSPLAGFHLAFAHGFGGLWALLHWLLLTPFFWISGVWYRRMRHLTMGDWFTERYESRGLGAMYAIFSLAFVAAQGSLLFTATARMTQPLLGMEHVRLFGQLFRAEYVFIAVMAAFILSSVVVGGLKIPYAAHLLQAVTLFGLSLILVIRGAAELVDRLGGPQDTSLFGGFRILHQRVGPENFELLGNVTLEAYPLQRIVMLLLATLLATAVQPHMMAIGGGSAKTEISARVGLVAGNLLSCLSAVIWGLIALLALALYAHHPEVQADPQRTWKMASQNLMGPGLRGAMIVCLSMALIGSVGNFLLAGSALFVRNIYAAYGKHAATQQHYVWVGRIIAAGIVVGAALLSLFTSDLWQQLQTIWLVGLAFATPFWVGMYWRRASTFAAWCSVVLYVAIFAAFPFALPRFLPALRSEPRLFLHNRMVRTTTVRKATPLDAARVNLQLPLEMKSWDRLMQEIQQLSDADERSEHAAKLGARPKRIQSGDVFNYHTFYGGQAIFWSDGLQPVDERGAAIAVLPETHDVPLKIDPSGQTVEMTYPAGLRFKGQGTLRVEFLLLHLMGVPLTLMSNASLDSLSLLLKIAVPLLAMILISYITRPAMDETLDRFYAKMHTPAHPDPEIDSLLLDEAYQYPSLLEDEKLLPETPFEFQRPGTVDISGAILACVASLLIIGILISLARLGV